MTLLPTEMAQGDKLIPLNVGESSHPLAWVDPDGEPFDLNVGCGPHYADDWVNTDLVATEAIQPDLVVTSGRPFPFKAGSVRRAYLGHVLEHVPWSDLPGWLDELHRVLVAGAPLMIVGPDTVRVLERWKADQEPWGRVAAVMEGPGAYLEHLGQFAELRWDADRHHWNCHEARVVEVLEAAGFVDVTPHGVLDDGRLDERALSGWPLVDASPCQFAVSAVAP